MSALFIEGFEPFVRNGNIYEDYGIKTNYFNIFIICEGGSAISFIKSPQKLFHSVVCIDKAYSIYVGFDISTNF